MPTLGPAKEEAYAREVAETNRRRLVLLMPLMAVVHVAHILAFRVPADERATLPAQIVAWRNAVVDVHAATLAVVLLLWAAVLAGGRGRYAGLLAPAVATTYLLHAAAIAGADQLNAASVTPYIAYSLGAPIVICLGPVDAAAAYTLGLTAYFVALFTMQPSATIRGEFLPMGVTVTVVSLVLAAFQHTGRRRDFAQRATQSRRIAHGVPARVAH
jgi:hypothetical protein